jgi:hypothetical protein
MRRLKRFLAEFDSKFPWKISAWMAITLSDKTLRNEDLMMLLQLHRQCRTQKYREIWIERL